MKYKFAVPVIILLILCLFLYYINYQQRDRVVFSSLSTQPELGGETIKIMTYNIQRGLDNNGVRDFAKTVLTIKNSKSQIIGLNEVDNKMLRSGFIDQISFLAGELNMNYVFGPTLSPIIGSYGNALLTVFPVIEVKNRPLPVNIGQEPRGVLEADLLLPEENILKVLVTHLSTDKEVRSKQCAWLNDFLQVIKGPFILMGDFNSENIYFDKLPDISQITEKTYPASKPTKNFDMFFTNCKITEDSYTIKTDASDHLPLIIELPMSYNNK